jgi:hypothetical protein
LDRIDERFNGGKKGGEPAAGIPFVDGCAELIVASREEALEKFFDAPFSEISIECVFVFDEVNEDIFIRAGLFEERGERFEKPAHFLKEVTIELHQLFQHFSERVSGGHFFPYHDLGLHNQDRFPHFLHDYGDFWICHMRRLYQDFRIKAKFVQNAPFLGEWVLQREQIDLFQFFRDAVDFFLKVGALQLQRGGDLEFADQFESVHHRLEDELDAQRPSDGSFKVRGERGPRVKTTHKKNHITSQIS